MSQPPKKKRLVELDEHLYLNGSWGRFLKIGLWNGWYFNIFWGPTPKIIARLNFPCPMNSIFGFWLRKLLSVHKVLVRRLPPVRVKKTINKSRKKIQLLHPKSAKVLCNRLFFSFFCSPKKNNGRKCMVRIRRKNNDGVSGRNWRILWMFIGGESSKVQLGEKMSDGKGELWVLEM